MTKLLLIHGINNEGNSKENIEQHWGGAIRRGVPRSGDATLIAAFYGDLLHQETESWDKNQDAATPMSATSEDEDFVDENIAAFYLEMQRAHNVSDDQVKQFLDEGDELEHARSMANGVHKKWLKAIARTLESLLPTNGKYVARAFLRQAAAYLHKPGLKERVDDLVKGQLFDQIDSDEKVIVVSHSLGTVVAYSLLRRLRTSVKAKLLLTAGSPLGIQIVKNRLGPPLICLANVDRWVNASDPEDFVALRPKLTQKNFGCGQIENFAELDNGKEDAHDILRYLRQPEVARAVADEL